MRGRTSHITAVLAVLTVVAIVTTGIALGLVRNGGPWVMLLGPSSNSGSMAEAEPVAVADSGTSQAGDDRSWTDDRGSEPVAPPSPSVQPEVPAGTTSTAGVQRSAGAPAVSDPVAAEPVDAKEPSPRRSSPPASIEARIDGGDSNSAVRDETQPPPETESSVDPVIMVGVDGRSGDLSAGWSASEPEAGADALGSPDLVGSGPTDEQAEGDEMAPEPAAGLE
jgi:hypothetical protein